MQDDNNAEAEAALRDWSTATLLFLTLDVTGHLAAAAVAKLGASGMARMKSDEAERLAFAATTELLRRHLARQFDNVTAFRRLEEAALDWLSFEAIDGWSTLTGLSPFGARLSRNAPEALGQYRAARLCDQICEAHEMSRKEPVLCWFKVADREALRAVMMDLETKRVNLLPREMVICIRPAPKHQGPCWRAGS